MFVVTKHGSCAGFTSTFQHFLCANLQLMIVNICLFILYDKFKESKVISLISMCFLIISNPKIYKTSKMLVTNKTRVKEIL